VEVLQGHKGKNLSAKGLFDPATHCIDVLSMKLRRSDANVFAQLTIQHSGGSEQVGFPVHPSRALR